MNPIRSTTFRGDEESRSTRSEDHNTCSVLRSRTEDEKQRRRREWQRQQERERQHEKLKQQKILEYEKKRAQALKYAEGKSSRHSRSKSGSESPSHRGRSTSTDSKSGSLHEKLDEPTSGTVPLFRGPQNAQINTMELRRIKVDIHRNIPVQGPVPELQRDILNPEDVNVKRREASTNKSRTSKRRSLSLSPIRNHIYSSRYPPSYQSRHRIDLKHQDNKTENCDIRKNDGPFMGEKSCRDRYREKSNERSYERRDRDRDRGRDRDRDRDRERERERDRDRDRDRKKDRGRSRERRDIAPHYIESPIPVPISYGSFPPRPIVVSFMVPLRGQIPLMGRGRHPALMAPVRLFPPRFPPHMYRLGHPPPNPF